MTASAPHIVFVIDDDARLRDDLVDYLVGDGYEAMGFASYEQFLPASRLIQPALVVLDLGLPGLDGLDVCPLLRTLWPEIGVVMLTSRSGVAQQEAGMNAGADAYLSKTASLALVVILLPSVTRVVEEVLRVVPSGLREASLALGAPEWRTVWSVVLPTARSGVVTAVLLGIARIVGETAPLLFTAFGSQVVNWRGYFNHDQGALPLVIFSDVRQAQPVLINLAFQAAFVLMSIVLILFVLARIFSRPKGKNGKRIKPGPNDDDLMARLFVPIPIEQNEETR